MNSLTVKADKKELQVVMEFVEKQLERLNCSGKGQMQICLAVEEVFVNIANYAYQQGEGETTIKCETEGEAQSICLEFRDHGQPYNPLEKEDPDITLSAGKRNIGGLGIFLVKKNMDEVSYKYEDGMNVLSMKKKIG